MQVRDEADRLTKFDNSSGTDNDAVYAYLPGSGMRYKRTQGSTVEYFIHDGDNVIGSYTAGGTLNARYVTPGLDDNLSETRGGSTYYYMQDGLGSVRNIVDSSETLQNRYDHYAFGNNIGGAQLYGVDNTYWYTGREYEWGGIHATHYYRNRYYVSALGIFASRDAAWADIHRGWGYVGNRPTYYVDPYGFHEAEGAPWWDLLERTHRLHDWLGLDRPEENDPEAADGVIQRLITRAYASVDPTPGRRGYLDCLGDCIRDTKKSHGALAKSLSYGTFAVVGDKTLNYFFAAVGSGIGRPPHWSSWQHVAASGISHAGREGRWVAKVFPAANWHAVHRAGRLVGRTMKKISPWVVIADGAYNAGVMSYCANKCRKCP